jgi:hypothetical protein
MIRMYGLNIDLPEGWVDVTEYGFEAEDGPITKLVFAREPLLPFQVEPWLEELRAKVAAIGLRTLPIISFDNPSLPIRGFEAILERGGERGGTSFYVISYPEHAVVIQAKWEGAAEPLLRDLVRSVRYDSRTSAPTPLTPGIYCYAVCDLLFDSAIVFAPPWSFVFRSTDERGRLWCSVRPREAAFEPPDFSTRFDVPPNAVSGQIWYTHGRLTSVHVTPPDSAGLEFEQHRWVSTAGAEEGTTTEQLTWAEARTVVNTQLFRFWFAHQGDGREAASIWSALLLGARRD